MFSQIVKHFSLFVIYLLPPTHFYKLKRLLLCLAGYTIGDNVRVVSTARFYIPYLSIGDNTWIGQQVLFAGGGAQIKIGSNVDIGPRVLIVSGSHEIGNSYQRAGLGFSEDIIVGNGVWIGAASTILGGVKIGDGAVIAAGSLVRDDIPPNTLAAGVPAVVIRHL